MACRPASRRSCGLPHCHQVVFTSILEKRLQSPQAEGFRLCRRSKDAKVELSLLHDRVSRHPTTEDSPPADGLQRDLPRPRGLKG